jgi:primary-amine oxidase
LPAYRAAGRDLVDTDVVLWATCGSNHVSRTEDWPVMPVERTGFTLRPTGFFDRNPALDVPPQELVDPATDGHCG